MKFLKNHILPLLAVVGGVAVLFLRLSHLATVDAKGLLASGHIAGILAGVLTLLIPAVLLWRSLVLPKDQACDFPASATATLGYCAAAFGIGYTAPTLLLNQPDNLLPIAGFVGIVAAVALVLLASFRWQGLRANVLYYGAVCLFFMLLLICQYRMWSSEPQLQLYGCSLLATVCLMIGSYHRACFDGKLGLLRMFTFFRSAGIFFCLAAIPGSIFWVLYLTGAIWSLADLLNLTREPQEGGCDHEAS